MNQPRILRIYLEDGLRQSAESGAHNFISLIAATVATAGYRVEFRPDTLAERLKSTTRRGYALFHMDGPAQDRTLIFRRVYHYPFWAIEPSPKRWEWHVARSEFPESDVPRKEADRFYGFWRKRLFGITAQDITRDGPVYVPLQGRLLEHRSFQASAPIVMLQTVLDHAGGQPVTATLHPKETYSAAERQALAALGDAHPNLSIQTGGMESLLRVCTHVVTQNSAAAFAGYVFGKPTVLFGRVDFHHIAANVHETGARAALHSVRDLRPDYAGYLHWFWQRMSINAGREDAGARIRAALSRAGWPV